MKDDITFWETVKYFFQIRKLKPIFLDDILNESAKK